MAGEHIIKLVQEAWTYHRDGEVALESSGSQYHLDDEVAVVGVQVSEGINMELLEAVEAPVNKQRTDCKAETAKENVKNCFHKAHGGVHEGGYLLGEVGSTHF